ncbi:MAG: hypothetical protein VYE73_05665 [Acidobacteriota bacterium]|nr:hypothetical protein [Acidobacteriota bacterium]
MSSEYDPFLPGTKADVDNSNLETVRDLFLEASMPYLSSPLLWFTWALILPGAALGTPFIAGRFGWLGVLLLWSLSILFGGVFEISSIRSGVEAGGSTPLSSWAFGVQANLSMIAIAFSLFLLWQQSAWALPALWLLVLGHSFVSLGGLSFNGLRQTGLLYQLGGVVALWPSGRPLLVLALTTFIANVWMGFSVSRRSARLE